MSICAIRPKVAVTPSNVCSFSGFSLQEPRRRRGTARSSSSAQPEMAAEPLAHLLDRLAHFWHTPRAHDERMLPLRHRVDLGGDLEVREPAPELGAITDEELALAVVHARGRQAGQIGIHEADPRSVNSRAGPCSHAPRR
jgi:hypothetical protein